MIAKFTKKRVICIYLSLIWQVVCNENVELGQMTRLCLCVRWSRVSMALCALFWLNFVSSDHHHHRCSRHHHCRCCLHYYIFCALCCYLVFCYLPCSQWFWLSVDYCAHLENIFFFSLNPHICLLLLCCYSSKPNIHWMWNNGAGILTNLLVTTEQHVYVSSNQNIQSKTFIGVPNYNWINWMCLCAFRAFNKMTIIRCCFCSFSHLAYDWSTFMCICLFSLAFCTNNETQRILN